MSNSDRSSSAATRVRHNRALAGFYTLNPGMRQSVNHGAGGQENTAKVTGLTAGPCCSPVVTCVPPGAITNLLYTFIGTPPSPYDVSYNYWWDITWDPIAGASSIQVTSTEPADLILPPGPTSASFYTNTGEQTITVTATNSCGSSSISEILACFLAGSPVQMADGSAKVIEEVAVGDLVLGAFGEINPVLALHRPILGAGAMCRINNEHTFTNHHPHISVDKKFHCINSVKVEEHTYGLEHEVIDGEGRRVMRHMQGLKRGRIQPLVEGVHLKTVEGERIVTTIDAVSMPPDTQLYHLVVGGSHTYHVDGYAVTGWPREDDFDYDTWTALSQ